MTSMRRRPRERPRDASLWGPSPPTGDVRPGSYASPRWPSRGDAVATRGPARRSQGAGAVQPDTPLTRRAARNVEGEAP